MVCINYTHQNSKALPGTCGGSVCMCHDCREERDEIRILSEYLNMVKWENKSIETLRAVRKAYLESHEDTGTVSLPKALTAENGAKALSCRTEWMIQGKYKDGKWIDIDQPRRTKPDITAEQRQKAKSSDCEMRIIRREIREWEVEE